MARLIKHTATGPKEIPASERSTWVCMCGLAKTYPLCDGSHKRVGFTAAAGAIELDLPS